MSKKLSVVLVAAMMLVALLGVPALASDVSVGIVFSTGGLGDQSFNDAAYRGLEEAVADFGIDFSFVEPTDVAEMEEHLRAYAQAGYNLVIAVGFQQESALEVVSEDYVNTNFAIIDAVVDNPNVANLLFAEHEGSFLVGILAAMMSETGTVGFVGGIESPVITRFQVGFEQGVAWAEPDVNVLINYAGSFGDPGRGKELAISQNERGADVIYHASGGTGNGVIEAAEEGGFFAIGVDSDQDHLAPGTVLTSMLKKVDVAVYELISEMVEGRFEPGIHTFGIANDGVGLSEMRYTRDMIPDEVLAAVDEARTKIAAGELEVRDR